MKVRTITASSKEIQFYQAYVALTKKYLNEMDASTILAIVSNVVGKTVALQDQSTMSPERAMAIVEENIRLGNNEAIEMLQGTKGSA